jgi:transcriptional regulator
MFQILKLRIQGDTAYKIARKLNLDPPQVYRTLRFAKANFEQANNMIEELKRLGWPQRLLEVENEISTSRVQKKRRITQTSGPQARSEEIAIKLG